MPQICPHCRQMRPENSDAPDWQCPFCERAYAKSASDGVPSAGVVTMRPRQRDGGGGKWVFVFLMIAALAWWGRPLWQGHPQPAVPAAGQPEVLLYATDWCGYCKATREFFRANGIRYTEYDIEKSSAALAGHQKLGGNGVPLVVVGDEVVRGYNEATLRQLLKPWLRGS